MISLAADAGWFWRRQTAVGFGRRRWIRLVVGGSAQ